MASLTALAITFVLSTVFPTSCHILDCTGKPDGWKSSIFCPNGGLTTTCNGSQCSSCEDCLRKFSNYSSAVWLIKCNNQLSSSQREASCPACSYCLGCNTSNLVRDSAPGYVNYKCQECNIATTVFWEPGKTYTGALGNCDVNLTCGQYPGYGQTTLSPIVNSLSCFVSDLPNVVGVFPSGGPQAGGTIIELQGSLLSNVASVKIGGNECDLSRFSAYINDSFLMCNTSQSSNIGLMAIQLLTATYPGQWINNSSVKFEYRSNPVVASIDYVQTVSSGGISLVFSGQHLGASDNPLLTIDARCRVTSNVVANFTSDCNASDNEMQLICLTPDMSTVSSFPCPRSVLQAASMETYNSSYSKFDFLLGLIFDGYVRYENLSMLPQFQQRGYLQVYDNIQIFRFEDMAGVRVYDPSSDNILTVHGQSMNVGAQFRDYKVTLGSGTNCTMLQVLSNQLTCRPPLTEPPFDPNNFVVSGGKKAISVVVTVGYSSTAIGYLSYSSGVSTWAIAVAIVVPTVAVAVLVGVTVYCVRKQRRMKWAAKTGCVINSNRQSVNLYQNHEMRAHHTAGDGTASQDISVLPAEICKQLVSHSISVKSVRLADQLGQGQFGKIFLATVNSTMQAAAKVLKEERPSQETLAKFMEEALIMKDFHHPNVLALVGVVLDGLTPMVLVPLMKNGDLRTALKKKTFSLGDLVNFCLQIAQGMEYLSGLKFIHRDLAARNCLLDENYVVKICDFGLSHELDTKDYYKGQDQTKPLPVKWMAIECLANGIFTTSSDVWSYGVLMWEIMSKGTVPYSDVNNYEMKRYLVSGQRLDRPTAAPEPIYAIMRKCWNSVASRRPSFADLLASINGHILSAVSPAMERLYTKDATSEPYSYAACLRSNESHRHSVEQRDTYAPQYIELLSDSQHSSASTT